MSRRPVDQALWQPWIDHVCTAVGVDPARVDTVALHDLSGEVANVFTRPMAPVSTFLLGLAVGSGIDPDTAHGAVVDAAAAAPANRS